MLPTPRTLTQGSVLACPDPEAHKDPPDNRDPLDFLVLVARMENRDLADPQVQGGFPDQPVKMETTERRVCQENRDPRDKQENPVIQEVQECLGCLE